MIHLKIWRLQLSGPVMSFCQSARWHTAIILLRFGVNAELWIFCRKHFKKVKFEEVHSEIAISQLSAASYFQNVYEDDGKKQKKLGTAHRESKSKSENKTKIQLRYQKERQFLAMWLRGHWFIKSPQWHFLNSLDTLILFLRHLAMENPRCFVASYARTVRGGANAAWFHPMGFLAGRNGLWLRP